MAKVTTVTAPSTMKIMVVAPPNGNIFSVGAKRVPSRRSVADRGVAVPVVSASSTTRDCVCRVLALQDIATCSQFRSRSSIEMQVPEVMGPEGRERYRSTAIVSCPQRPSGPVIRSTRSFEYRALTERGTRWIMKAFLPSRAVGVDATTCFPRASALFHWTQSS